MPVGDMIGNLGESFGIGNNSGNAASNAVQAANSSGVDELRRQFDITQKNIDPFIQAGTEALSGVVGGSSASGIDERLIQIFNTDIFKNLLGERTRAVEGQLSAGGQMRSGAGLQAAANIPTDLGLALENLIFGRQSNLAGSGQNAAVGLGGLGAQNSQGIAALLSGIGEAEASGILVDAQARAKGQENLQKTTTQIATAFFSDPALKENVEEIGLIGNLKVYQWDWIKKAKKTIVRFYPTIGFMADEVEELYPEYVSEYCGIKVVNYPKLLDRLEAA